MPTASVTIDRAGLSLADLVAPNDPTSDFYFPEDGLRFPRLSLRKVYAPESEFIGGRVKLAQVPGVADYPVTFYAHADTTAALFVLMDELEAAVTQFTFDLTVTIDGEARTYLAEGDFPDWGEVDSGMVRAHLVKGTVTFNLLTRVA